MGIASYIYYIRIILILILIIFIIIMKFWELLEKK